MRKDCGFLVIEGQKVPAGALFHSHENGCGRPDRR
jgi:hypothetical protein